MMNDQIDIYDATILNLGFDYEMIVHPTRDKTEVLNDVNMRLKKYLSEKMYIGESFYLINVYNVINKTPGVIDTTKVVPNLKVGSDYSSPVVSLQEIKSSDGTYLRAPRNVIFEIKNFNADIRGSAI